MGFFARLAAAIGGISHRTGLIIAGIGGVLLLVLMFLMFVFGEVQRVIGLGFFDLVTFSVLVTVWYLVYRMASKRSVDAKNFTLYMGLFVGGYLFIFRLLWIWIMVAPWWMKLLVVFVMFAGAILALAAMSKTGLDEMSWYRVGGIVALSTLLTVPFAVKLWYSSPLISSVNEYFGGIPVGQVVFDICVIGDHPIPKGQGYCPRHAVLDADKDIISIDEGNREQFQLFINADIRVEDDETTVLAKKRAYAQKLAIQASGGSVPTNPNNGLGGAGNSLLNQLQAYLPPTSSGSTGSVAPSLPGGDRLRTVKSFWQFPFDLMGPLVALLIGLVLSGWGAIGMNRGQRLSSFVGYLIILAPLSQVGLVVAGWATTGQHLHYFSGEGVATRYTNRAVTPPLGIVEVDAGSHSHGSTWVLAYCGPTDYSGYIMKWGWAGRENGQPWPFRLSKLNQMVKIPARPGQSLLDIQANSGSTGEILVGPAAELIGQCSASLKGQPNIYTASLDAALEHFVRTGQLPVQGGVTRGVRTP